MLKAMNCSRDVGCNVPWTNKGSHGMDLFRWDKQFLDIKVYNFKANFTWTT